MKATAWLALIFSGAVFLGPLEVKQEEINYTKEKTPPPKKAPAQKKPKMSPARQKLFEALKDGEMTLNQINALIDEVRLKK